MILKIWGSEVRTEMLYEMYLAGHRGSSRNIDPLYSIFTHKNKGVVLKESDRKKISEDRSTTGEECNHILQEARPPLYCADPLAIDSRKRRFINGHWWSTTHCRTIYTISDLQEDLSPSPGDPRIDHHRSLNATHQVWAVRTLNFVLISQSVAKSGIPSCMPNSF